MFLGEGISGDLGKGCCKGLRVRAVEGCGPLKGSLKGLYKGTIRVPLKGIIRVPLKGSIRAL